MAVWDPLYDTFVLCVNIKLNHIYVDPIGFAELMAMTWITESDMPIYIYYTMEYFCAYITSDVKQICDSSCDVCAMVILVPFFLMPKTPR